MLLFPLGATVSAAPAAGAVHFTAAGDFSAGTNAGAVLTKINSLDSDLSLALGDLSYGATGEEQAWCDFVTSKVGPGYPFELVAGNHEAGGQNGNINDFSACLPNQIPELIGTYGRQYFVDVPAADPLVRFISISPALTFPDGTYSYGSGSARYQWTAQAIDGARDAGVPWVVVSMHKPCLTVGQYSCDPGADLFNLLLSKKVDLILSSHEHSYQRSKQLALSASCPSLAPGSYSANCVVDSDSSLIKGAGSVMATVGTGGQNLYDINSADPEAGYFAATSGANQNPTWGALDVDVTADSLQASFVRASGGSFTDAFTIAKSTAANAPPSAAFTSSCSDLGCAFDGTGSSDPDGSVASYAWSFGDGTSGSGASPNHTYASAGSYTVALTVTDDAGANDTVTHPVTVTSPTTTTYVSDSFSRTVTGGFGAAPTGGAWTLAGSSSLFAVADGVGSIRTGAGSGPGAYLNSVSARDSDLRLSYSIDKQPTGSGLYLSSFLRRGSAGAYFAKVRIDNTGRVLLELDRSVPGGADVVLAPAVTVSGVTYSVGDTLLLRLQAVGAGPTTLRAKVWKSGTSEPTAWHRSATDATTGVQVAGSVGVSPYLSSAATNAPISMRLDELTVTSP
jgi:PKD repeat protein